MILDGSMQLSNQQQIWGGTGELARPSTNNIDFGVPAKTTGALANSARDVGNGNPLEMVCMVVQPFAGLSLLEVHVQTDSTLLWTAPRTVFRSPIYPVAKLVYGFRLLPRELPVGLDGQYMRLWYVMTGVATSGQITAAVIMGDR